MTRQIKDLAYNEKQSLDLYLVGKPDQPLIVCLHGGGFHSGSKDDNRCNQSASILVEAGFNCASISYSLAPRNDRFSMWPRNLFDVADAVAFLYDRANRYDYDFGRLGMLGFSAGCCLSNLYIQGGKEIFDYFKYRTRVFRPAALAGFYGPYDFAVRQAERRSEDPGINRDHSPSHWLRNSTNASAPPVLHIQGDRDTVVYPEQHEAFQRDYEERGFEFNAVLVADFGHSFSPLDSNASGETIDMSSALTGFFSQHLRGEAS